ncbi:hypothetical protein HAX54_028088 [Datura stramonium]|uniref:Uncharacterized protein n=1 Tax=Datura stramonium TaxID=4076 RepID=A0ABS8V6R5_DATST|nr:hypothetical protein [Datura stramonium]
MAVADSGYVAPEHVKGGSGSPNSKPKGEQSLVEWASSKLHDGDSLLEMVDPTMKRTISTRALSSYADIISQCIQVAKSGQEKAKFGKDKKALKLTPVADLSFNQQPLLCFTNCKLTNPSDLLQ